MDFLRCFFFLVFLIFNSIGRFLNAFEYRALFSNIKMYTRSNFRRMKLEQYLLHTEFRHRSELPHLHSRHRVIQSTGFNMKARAARVGCAIASFCRMPEREGGYGVLLRTWIRVLEGGLES